MNKKKLALVLGAVPVAGLGFHPMLAAQETDKPVFEEVIVTAQKREQSIYDVPVAISLAATFAFLLICLGGIWWIFRTGYRLKQ